MAKERRIATVVYHAHQLEPKDFLHFVELDEFSQDWEGLGLNLDEDMWALTTQIMVMPQAPVIRGTGGLRKLRFAPPSWQKGKSGGVRVCYAYFPEHWTVLLVMAYIKKDKDNLSAEEKRAISDYLKEVDRYLEDRNY